MYALPDPDFSKVSYTANAPADNSESLTYSRLALCDSCDELTTLNQHFICKLCESKAEEEQQAHKRKAHYERILKKYAVGSCDYRGGWLDCLDFLVKHQEVSSTVASQIRALVVDHIITKSRNVSITQGEVILHDLNRKTAIALKGGTA